MRKGKTIQNYKSIQNENRTTYKVHLTSRSNLSSNAIAKINPVHLAEATMRHQTTSHVDCLAVPQLACLDQGLRFTTKSLDWLKITIIRLIFRQFSGQFFDVFSTSILPFSSQLFFFIAKSITLKLLYQLLLRKIAPKFF